MCFIKKVILQGIVYQVAFFWGWISIFKLGSQWLIKGNKFWRVKERPLPPSELQNPEYGRHSYINLKDIKIHYVENGDKSKPLMLFVHGFPEFWYSWRHQLKYFAKTHWVVAIDMRGYGDSEKPAGIDNYSLDHLRNDIIRIVKALGRKDCILVAHDWGGAIAWDVASKNPEVVQKLILLNAPHPTAFGKLFRNSFSQFVKSWYIFLFQLPYLPETSIYNDDLAIFRQIFGKSSTDEEIETYKYTFSKKESWTPPINYYRSVMSVILAGAASAEVLKAQALPKVTKPTLIIWGEDDVSLDRSLPELARPYVENLKIDYILGGNHFIQFDKPAEVNQLIQSFL